MPSASCIYLKKKEKIVSNIGDSIIVCTRNIYETVLTLLSGANIFAVININRRWFLKNFYSFYINSLNIKISMSEIFSGKKVKYVW